VENPSGPFRGLRELRGRRASSPRRLSRHDVVVPCRVLPDSGVSGCLGSLFPVRSWRSLNAQSFRYSCRCPCSRKRLLERSSPGVRPTYTVCPAIPALGLSAEGTSPGVPCPYSARGEGNPRPDQLPSRAPRCLAGVSTGRSHPAGYGVARRFSQPLSDFLFPPPSCHVSDRWRSWDLPFRGLLLSRRPGDSSPPACPLDVAPAGCASPVLGGGASWRAAAYLGEPASTFGRLQGLHPRESRSASPGHD
jgi:hypothetical protein